MKVNNRILIVDDDPNIHEDFVKILTPINFSELDRELGEFEQSLFNKPPPEPVLAETITYVMDHAYRAENALDQILAAEDEGNPFSVVFTDVRIPPGTDGIQLVRMILNQAPNVQIVIVTAFSDYSWEEITQIFGWTDQVLILRKPVDPITIKQVALMLTRKWTSEAELRRHRTRLEDMVTKRTEKLTRTNEELEREIAVRQKAEEALQAAGAHLERANQDLKFEVGQRRQTEEQLKVLLHELERANKELEDFAYIVSHDLKAPLRAISSITSWFVEDFEEKLGEAGAEYITDLQDQTRWMHNLVEGILEYARLGRARCQLKRIDTHDLVCKVVEVLNPPEEVGIEVKTLPTLVYDRTHLEQVMQNLISNAVKHMGENGGSVTISAQEDENYWRLDIKDTGPGIERRHYDRIFKMFQTLTPREGHGSTGIGLALVKRIAERHGGKIWLTSKPGAGSTFSLYIPRDLEPKVIETHTVLVIDDNENFSEIALTLLKRAGFHPLHAINGNDARELMDRYSGSIDLALLDLNLPGENVLELFPLLRELRPEMKIVACTGDPDSQLLATLMQMGLAGVLTKPFNIEELNQLLERILL